MSKLVVALGGNALGDNVREQRENAKISAKAVADLVEAGHSVVVVHGNGPQVGMIKLTFDGSAETMPLPECIAMSQGYIGYHLQQALQAELEARGIGRSVATVLTQVVVEQDDPAFVKPTKPIGKFYDEQTARKLMKETGSPYAEDAGRGWRLVVPSPRPVDIREKHTIAELSERGQLVIACGGGGVPVVKQGEAYGDVDAVIDKDFAAAKLAELIGADILFILTAVERASINFRKPDEKALERLTVSEAEEYCNQGHFAPGSMLPKITASILFVKSGAGRRAIIGSLNKAAQALNGESGTLITE